MDRRRRVRGGPKPGSLLLTFDDSAPQARDGLDLSHFVLGEVAVTGGVGTVAENVPQVRGHAHVLHHRGLSARFKMIISQSSVSHQTDSENGGEERDEGVTTPTS